MLLKFLKAQITGFASRLEFCKRHLLEYLRISKPSPQMSVLCVFECVCFFQTQQSTTTMRRALSIDSTRLDAIAAPLHQSRSSRADQQKQRGAAFRIVDIFTALPVVGATNLRICATVI